MIDLNQMPDVIRDHNARSRREDSGDGLHALPEQKIRYKCSWLEVMVVRPPSTYFFNALRGRKVRSISAAASYVRSRAIDFGIEPPLFDKRDIHVHVPEGATPKDGPSAGIGMATAIVSVLTSIPVRHDIAMTGEVTLRGRVLPIGGLKEKLLAALRGGVTKVLIPEENAKDLVDLPASVKNGMEIVPVSRMEEVIRHALVRQPQAIEWEEDVSPVKAATPATDDDASGVMAH